MARKVTFGGGKMSVCPYRLSLTEWLRREGVCCIICNANGSLSCGTIWQWHKADHG